MWENLIKSKYVKIMMNNQNIMLGYPPYGKNRKIEKCLTINFDECWKLIFDRPRST